MFVNPAIAPIHGGISIALLAISMRVLLQDQSIAESAIGLAISNPASYRIGPGNLEE
jgi:hypothetical protein